MSRNVIAPFMLAAAISFTACGGSSKSADNKTTPAALGQAPEPVAEGKAPTAAEATPSQGGTLATEPPAGTESMPSAPDQSSPGAMPSNDRQPVSGSTSDSTGTATGTIDKSAPGTSPDTAPGASAAFTEPTIFAALGAANHAEIDAGQLAIQKAKNKDVKKFARQMVAEHKQMLAAGDKTAKKLSITPEDNSDVTSLKDDARTSLEKLRGLDGAEFDRAYMSQMVADHEKVLTLIDNQIMPAASSNPQILTLVKGARPKVEAHLGHARALNDKLSK